MSDKLQPGTAEAINEHVASLERENAALREALIAAREFLPSLNSLPKAPTAIGDAVRKVHAAIEDHSQDTDESAGTLR